MERRLFIGSLLGIPAFVKGIPSIKTTNALSSKALESWMDQSLLKANHYPNIILTTREVRDSYAKLLSETVDCFKEDMEEYLYER